MCQMLFSKSLVVMVEQCFWQHGWLESHQTCRFSPRVQHPISDESEEKKQNKNKSLLLCHFNDFSVDRQRQLGQNRRLRRQRQLGRHPAGLRLEEIFSSEAKCWSVNVSRSRQMHSISWQLGKRDFFLLWYNFVGAGDRPLRPSNTLSCTTISWFNLFDAPMDVLRHIHLPSYSKHI